MTKEQFERATVPITIGGEERLMRCTIDGYWLIDRKCKGIYTAWQGVINGQMDTIATVIAAGLGLKTEEAAALPDQLIHMGVRACAAPAMELINLYLDGGVDRTDEIRKELADDGTGEAGQEAAELGES